MNTIKKRRTAPGLRLAVKAAGSMSTLARSLKITPQAVAQWKTIPTEHIISIEKLTGIDRAELRPDLYKR